MSEHTIDLSIADRRELIGWLKNPVGDLPLGDRLVLEPLEDGIRVRTCYPERFMTEGGPGPADSIETEDN